MASITAVELGTDTCAFARTSVRRGEVQLLAAEVLDPAAFPGLDAFTIAVRQTRRSMGLPRRCRVVLWGLPDGANRKDAAVKPLLAPLTNAGFRVDRVVTPCNALAALARLKPSRGEGATCWLGINRGGVAIVVVRPGKLLYAHAFIWDSQIGASGSQARLLQRYSLVSFLAPEMKRAMAEARKSGTPVDAVVTCGNLPDLRSLTMPLIEELDVEVETLDSLEGLTVKPQLAEKIGHEAPAIRLACAAAIARGTRPWDPSKKREQSRAITRYVAAAAILAAVLGVTYQWYGKPRNITPTLTSVQSTNRPPKGGNDTAGIGATAPVAKAPVVSAPAVRATTPPPPPAKPIVAAALPPARPPAVSVPALAVSVPAKKPESNPKKPESSPPPVSVPPSAVSVRWTNLPPKGESHTAGIGATAPVAKAPVVSAPAGRATTPPLPAAKPIAPALPPARPPAVSGQSTNLPPKGGNYTARIAATAPTAQAPVVSAPAARATTPPLPAAKPIAAALPPASPPAVSVPAKKPESNPTTLNTPAVSADNPDARVPAPAGAGVPRGPAPPLLKDAVPRVTAILVSRDRRFATIDDGQIIGIGDLLGRRTVVSMDERSVVFQEPSGMQIRIGPGGRLLGIDRAMR
jgi:hypothetical protein